MSERRTVGHSVRTLDNLMMRNLTAAVRERGIDELTAMHGWILGYLYRNQDRDIFQKDVEEEFEICSPTVSNIVKLMEKKGYIRREAAVHDARMKKLVLTDNGRSLHVTVFHLMKELEDRTVEGIPKEELDTFYAVVDQIKGNIQTILGETTC